MKNLFEMLQAIFGKNIISGTIGTRTNVIKLPSNKASPLKNQFDVFRSSENPAVFEKLKKVIEDEAPYISKMNDAERLIYEGNVKRLHDYLVSIGEIKPTISAEVIGLGTKEPIAGKGLASLVEEAGQTSPPGTLVGDIESRINKLKSLAKEKGMSAEEVLQDFASGQKGMLRLQDEGLVRSTARQILINDIKAGKIKNITVSEVTNMKEPIDSFRQIYGEGALEQLDSLIPNFRSLKTELEAEKLARSKFKFEPDENRLPGSVSIEEAKKAEQEFGINKPKQAEVTDITGKVYRDTNPDELIKEYNTNKQLLSQVDQEGGTSIGYQQFQELQKRNTEIEKILDSVGIKSAPEVKPEGIVVPFKKKPEEFAIGGSVGLDYLTGQNSTVERENFGIGGIYKVITKEPASIISAVSQPSSPPPITTPVVRPEDEILMRYREYMNASKPSQSDLENKYRELIRSTPATGLPVSIPTPVNEESNPIKSLMSFTSPEGEKIDFSSLMGFVKPNGEPYTGPVPENIQNVSRMIAAEGGSVGLDYLTGK
jgi:hypothetical protein